MRYDQSDEVRAWSTPFACHRACVGSCVDCRISLERRVRRARELPNLRRSSGVVRRTELEHVREGSRLRHRNDVHHGLPALALDVQRSGGDHELVAGRDGETLAGLAVEDPRSAFHDVAMHVAVVPMNGRRRRRLGDERRWPEPIPSDVGHRSRQTVEVVLENGNSHSSSLSRSLSTRMERCACSLAASPSSKTSGSVAKSAVGDNVDVGTPRVDAREHVVLVTPLHHPLGPTSGDLARTYGTLEIRASTLS